MLIRHSAGYLLARGLPGVINLTAVALYTRFLTTGEYGLYVLVITGAGLINAVFFQWLRLGLLRFYPAYSRRREEFLSTLAAVFVFLMALTGLLGAGGLFAGAAGGGIIILGLLLLWTQSWFELNLELSRAGLAPARYGMLAAARAVSALAVSIFLLWRGWGVEGILSGLISGSLISSLAISRREWKGAGIRRAEAGIFNQLFKYGLPLSVNFALVFIIDSSDRLILGWLMGAGAAGCYSAGYDLANQSIGMLMAVINTAAFPLLVQALEQGGEKKARARLAQNTAVLFMAGLPAAAGFAMLSGNIAGVFLGESFRESAVSIMPWIALASFLAGIKTYCLDLSFQLGKKTAGQLPVALTAALINTALNLWWIPMFGLKGAAYATVMAYLAASAMSLYWGRKILVLPFPWTDVLKIFISASCMALILYPAAHLRGAGALAAQICLGAAVYTAMVLLLDVMEIRGKIVDLIRRRRDCRARG